ncbi:hypothetical protein ACTMTU_31960 [Streptomyces sp. OZ13]|uniref:hypothetical protein n=1 Tax=Streptomyces sp. OZ13 TaxID=3452210 RepID=UPI003F89DD5A
MPGQRKRKRRQQDASRRVTAPGAGRWDVVFETQDASEFRAHLRRLRSADVGIDWATARIDTLCGRVVHPTTYRLSLFVPDPEAPISCAPPRTGRAWPTW